MLRHDACVRESALVCGCVCVRVRGACVCMCVRLHVCGELV